MALGSKKGVSEIRNALTALPWVFFLTYVIAEIKLPFTPKLSGAPPHTLFRQSLCFTGKRYFYLLLIHYNWYYSLVNCFLQINRLLFFNITLKIKLFVFDGWQIQERLYNNSNRTRHASQRCGPCRVIFYNITYIKSIISH